MIKILKSARANVMVKDKETGLLLFRDSNLFVDGGRQLIADVFDGTTAFLPTWWVCDLGDDATATETDQVDLVGYISPLSFSSAVGYPTGLAGEPTGVHFQFEFDNTGYSGDQVIKELGLFYRPDTVTDDFPRRHTSTGATGYMVARLKTSYTSVTVGDGRTITIDWKILF